MMKRAFDICFSLTALLLAAPVIAGCAVAVKCDSPGPWLFRQTRTGKNGRTFEILKLRTMTHRRHTLEISEGTNDRRITAAGKWLRRLRLDELPQLVNVLKGDMSVVGPRPEVPRYTTGYTERQRIALSVRPGITDPASIRFRHEEEMLDAATDKERYYREVILPEKIEMQIDYVQTRTMAADMKIIGATLKALASDMLRKIHR